MTDNFAQLYDQLCKLRSAYWSSEWFIHLGRCPICNKPITFYINQPIAFYCHDCGHFYKDGIIGRERPPLDLTNVKEQIFNYRAKLLQLTNICPECLQPRQSLYHFYYTHFNQPYLALICDSCGAHLDQFGQIFKGAMTFPTTINAAPQIGQDDRPVEIPPSVQLIQLKDQLSNLQRDLDAIITAMQTQP